jgi:4-hydroxy-3-polyprenylbenzoate decarboxylase
MPALYAHPKTIDELIDQSVGRIFDLLGLDAATTKRWGEDLTQGRRRPQPPATAPKTPKR